MVEEETKRLDSVPRREDKEIREQGRSCEFSF